MKLACIRAVITIVIAAFVLSFLAMWFFPEITDPDPPSKSSSSVGFWIWGIAIAVGILEGWRSLRAHRKSSSEQVHEKRR